MRTIVGSRLQAFRTTLDGVKWSPNHRIHAGPNALATLATDTKKRFSLRVNPSLVTQLVGIVRFKFPEDPSGIVPIAPKYGGRMLIASLLFAATEYLPNPFVFLSVLAPEFGVFP